MSKRRPGPRQFTADAAKRAEKGKNSRRHRPSSASSAKSAVRVLAAETGPQSAALPHGWTTARIGDVLRLINGAAFKPTDWTDEGLPIVRIQNLNNPKAPFNHFAGALHPRFRLRKGDLVFAWSGTPGTSFGAHIWKGCDAWLNQHIFRVEFDARLFETEFLRLAINRNLGAYISQAHGGAGLAHITKGKFEAFDILLPPLAEQRRIVARLEELEARSRRAAALLADIPAQLAQARQSLLAAAFRGDLTAEWRKTLNTPTWRLAPLAEVILDKPKNGYSAQPVNYETPFRVLTLGATTSGRFDSSRFKYFEGPIADDSPLWLHPDDILIQRGNTVDYVGVPAIYDGKPGQFIYPDLMMRVRANELVTPQFLLFALSRRDARNFLRARATGTAGNMPKINQQVLLQVPIPLPPLPEQHEIVRRLEAALARLDATERAHAAAVADLDRLDQALLARAFSGRLVPQNPADEPAAVTLARTAADGGNPRSG